MLEELGRPYELRQVDFKAEALQSPEYLAVHPLGQLPAIEDGDVAMFESGAILEQGKLAPGPRSRDRAE